MKHGNCLHHSSFLTPHFTIFATNSAAAASATGELAARFPGRVASAAGRRTLRESAAVIALAVLPLAFERLSVRARAPLLVRVGLAVQQGGFWQVLLGAASHSFGG